MLTRRVEADEFAGLLRTARRPKEQSIDEKYFFGFYCLVDSRQTRNVTARKSNTIKVTAK
jgi:hypothetical protein